MRAPTIAKNYADALFTTGERTGHTERYAALMGALGSVVRDDSTVRVALESPRVPRAKKLVILQKTFGDLAPAQFVRFLHAVVKRGRQGLLPAIADQYSALVDTKFNRIHVGVTVARKADAALEKLIRDRLSEATGKDVITHFRTNEEILGGVVLRIGDRIMDGSLRRKMVALRKQMLG